MKSGIRAGALAAAIVPVLALALAPVASRAEQPEEEFVAASAEPEHWCGTNDRRASDELIRHQINEERLAALGKTGPAATTNTDVGNIAVVQDDNSIVTPGNLFDIKSKDTILFTPSGDGSYAIGDGGPAFDKGGDKLSGFTGAGLASPTDDGYKEVVFGSGFSFTFYGKTYDRMFVGTNGYITFENGDPNQFAAVSPSALRDEEPRIAPFWTDLDLTGLSAKSGVQVKQNSGSITVTWNKVPIDDTTQKSTFQVQLFADGRVAFVYKKVAGSPELVGISPGRGLADLKFVDFANPRQQPIDGAPFETFAGSTTVDITRAVRAFYTTHGDDYDFVYLWSDFDFDLGGGFAYYLPVQNNVRGIGRSVFNSSAQFGSAGKLKGFLNMSNVVNEYPSDPNQLFLGENSPLSILGQEQGHAWLAFMRFQDRNGSSTKLLGRDNSHWSPYFNTVSTITNGSDKYSSSMEGNYITDEGGGNFYTRQKSINYFSELDQYAMGFRGADEVSDMFLVDPGQGFSGTSPRTNVRITGTRKKITIEDIIAVEGPRVPSVADSQKDYRVAFMLLVRAGSQPSQATINKLENFRSAWERYFNRAVEGRGTLSAELVSAE